MQLAAQVAGFSCDDILCASRASISLIRPGGTDTQTARSQVHTPEHSWNFTCLNITSSRDGLRLPIYSYVIAHTHRSNHLHNASANKAELPFTPQPNHWRREVGMNFVENSAIAPDIHSQNVDDIGTHPVLQLHKTIIHTFNFFICFTAVSCNLPEITCQLREGVT